MYVCMYMYIYIYICICACTQCMLSEYVSVCDLFMHHVIDSYLSSV